MDQKKPIYQRFLDRIEEFGNRLPHPVILFMLLTLALILGSVVAAKLGLQVSVPLGNAEHNGFQLDDQGKVKYELQNIKNLLSADGIRFMVASFIDNFGKNPVIGMNLVAMLGMGLCEGSGFLPAFLKYVFTWVPRRGVTMMVVFFGIMAHLAADAGYVVMIPLGGVIFLALGRNPLAGLAAAFAGVAGGFAANIVPSPSDAILSGVTTAAAQLYAPGFVVPIYANYYFFATSAIILTLTGAGITEKIIEPRLGPYDGMPELRHTRPLDAAERRAVRLSLLAGLAYLAMIAALIIPWPGMTAGILCDQNTGAVFGSKAPFTLGIVMLLTFFFAVLGLTYGWLAKTFKTSREAIGCLEKTMSHMGSTIVLLIFASQFIECFKYSGLGNYLADQGANLIQGSGLQGLPAIIGFVLFVAFADLLIVGATSKWLLLSVVFVPMFMKLGYSPAFAQLTYRIGDSTSNMVSPVLSYMPLILGFFAEYRKDAGIGTVLSLMMPYSFIFMFVWLLQLVVWYLLGLPIGPGGCEIFWQPGN